MNIYYGRKTHVVKKTTLGYRRALTTIVMSREPARSQGADKNGAAKQISVVDFRGVKLFEKILKVLLIFGSFIE